MNYDPVFQFSEHFDNAYLQLLYKNNIELAIDVFEEYYRIISEYFEDVRNYMTSSDWGNAANAMHKLMKTVPYVGRTAQAEELLEIELQLHRIRQPVPASSTPAISIDINAIMVAFHRIQLEELAQLPHLLAEIDRMHVYLSHPQRHP